MSDYPIATAEDILGCDDVQHEVVPVPEWGVSVRVRSFSRNQLHQLRKAATVRGEVDAERLDLLLFIKGVEEPVFSDDQAAQLGEKNAGAIQRVLARIMAISGLDDGAAERAEANFRS